MGTKQLAIFGWISPEFILKSVKSSMQHGTSTKVAVLQMFYSLWSHEQWKTPLLVKGDDILPSYRFTCSGWSPWRKLRLGGPLAAWGLSQNMVYFQRRPLCLLDLKLYQNHIISCQILSQISNFSIWNLISKSHFMTFHDLQTWWTFQSFRCKHAPRWTRFPRAVRHRKWALRLGIRCNPGVVHGGRKNQFLSSFGARCFSDVCLSLSLYIYVNYMYIYIYIMYTVYIYMYSQCLFDLFSSPTRCVFFCC